MLYADDFTTAEALRSWPYDDAQFLYDDGEYRITVLTAEALSYAVHDLPRAVDGIADFTFLGGLLRWGGILALVAIVGAVLFELSLGMWFSLALIGLAGTAILYDTSHALRDYRDDNYVGAALELFASVALMFWYAVSLFSRD